jgi:predicted dehydrogenase
VHAVTTRRTGPYPTRDPDVGVIQALATSDLDLATWITGARYTSITARTIHHSGRRHEDLCVALGQLSDGTITNHHVDRISPLSEHTITAAGEHGTLAVNILTMGRTHSAVLLSESYTVVPTRPSGQPA